MFRFLPEQGSDFAANIDWVHNLITDISVFFTVAIVGAMIYFAVRYRQRKGVDHDTPQILGNNLLEVIWTVVPTLVCIFIAYYGVIYYHDMRTVPDDAITIDVRAQKWKWDFYYSNGKQSSDLVVPVNKPVKLVLSSRDVLHSFYLPAMRVKKDAVPGQYTYLWFRPIKVDTYQAYCTEYCGKDHSQMLAKLRVLPEAQYEQWVNDRSAEAALAKLGPAERGKTLYKEKMCYSCHTLDGSPLVGPSFLNIYHRKAKWADGAEYTVDEGYIHESIIEPNKRIVAGFPPNIMPSFAGQLNDQDIDGIIAYLKTLQGDAPVAVKAADTSSMSPAQRGEAVYKGKACMGCHSIDGSVVVGPSFKGLYGTPQKLTDGSTVNADDAYLAHSIQEPQAQIVAGFENKGAMPKLGLTDDEIKDVIEFMKTLK